MKLSTTFALAAIVSATSLPMLAPAQSWSHNDRHRSSQSQSDHRQQTKNQWRNLAIGAGAIGLLGLLKGDNTLMFGGAAGALYSLNRYEQDRKSQNKLDRARSSYFDRDHFYRDGVRFDRKLVTRNGQRYYQFQRHGR